ncbi:hypothetical protein V1J52_25190 [Streptomyces sp. TRM 70351]|uniref:hypothetical protein n=1 Tax=Streptomyces sp. TRM 70351 TaxID=3116552 RepID=UPI002E7B8E42|nr:hypothetical protein [Streptomyces sp. TRM 70351]MEE1931419.1 hypothetical protein [Streptomyces sp. TRM 70351]
MDDAPQAPAAPQRDGAPEPEPIRFYGTTWLDHSGGYAARRAALALGAFASAAAGVLVLRFAYEGLTIAEVGSLVNLLIVLAFALCSSLAFTRTWSGYLRRPAAPGAEGPGGTQGVRLIGFLGILLAYGVRSLVEAPGEKLHRAEYETAVARHERRRTARTGNPAGRRAGRGGKGRKR